MLHTEFRGNRRMVLGDILKGFNFDHIRAWGPSWSCDQHHVITFLIFFLSKANIQNLV